MPIEIRVGTSESFVARMPFNVKKKLSTNFIALVYIYNSYISNTSACDFKFTLISKDKSHIL